MTDRKKKYEDKRKIKKVSFNIDSEADLIKIVENIPDFSNWVKEQIKKYKPA